jgi:hypothetical protein
VVSWCAAGKEHNALVVGQVLGCWDHSRFTWSCLTAAAADRDLVGRIGKCEALEAASRAQSDPRAFGGKRDVMHFEWNFELLALIKLILTNECSVFVKSNDFH